MKPPCYPMLVALACSCSSPSIESPTRVTYSTPPMRVEPGQDLTVCSYVRAENDGPVDVAAFVTDQAPGGHHVVVYTVDHPVDLAPHPCTQGGSPGWDTVVVAQRQHDEVRFPEGVGYRLAPRQQLVVETHYINASDAPVDAASTLTVEYAPAGSVRERAGTAAPLTLDVGTSEVAVGGRWCSTSRCRNNPARWAS